MAVITAFLIWQVLRDDVISQPRCWGYMIGLACGVIALILAAPRFGNKYILVYLFLCSLIASVTVISARAFSSILALGMPLDQNPSTSQSEHPSCIHASAHISAHRHVRVHGMRGGLYLRVRRRWMLVQRGATLFTPLFTLLCTPPFTPPFHTSVHTCAGV